MLSKLGEIRRDEHCFDYSLGKSGKGIPDKIYTYTCHSQGGNQKWHVTEKGQIKHDSGLCMEMDENKIKIFMQKCDSHNKRQIFRWQKRQPGDDKHPTLPLAPIR